jgi:hypothetical protein
MDGGRVTLTYSLQSAADLHAKLKRDAAALDDEVNGDRFFNLVVTGLHLSEWVKKDESLAPEVKVRLNEALATQIMRVCEDLANASKHFVQRGKDSVRSAESKQGYGIGRYGKGGYGVGEESIDITLDNGTTIGAIAFSSALLATYVYVFDGAGSLPGKVGAAM